MSDRLILNQTLNLATSFKINLKISLEGSFGLVFINLVILADN